MKAILVNSKEQTVEVVDIENNLKAYYKQLDCNMVEAVYLQDSHVMYVDEEALFSPKETGFKIEGMHSPVIGDGLIFKAKPDGNEGNCELSEIDLRIKTTWYKRGVQ